MATQAPAFAAWLDHFFTAYYQRRPVNATFIGVHAHDHLLPDLSENGLADTVDEMRDLLRRLHALPAETLNQAESMDRELAEGFLEIQLWEHQSRHFQRGNPSFATGEAVFGVIALFLRPFAPIGERVDSAIARLEATPAFLAQARALIAEAPRAWCERAIRECAGALAFLGAGLDTIIHEQGITKSRLRAAADKAADAFKEHEAYLRRDLLAHPVEHGGCGEEALSLLLRRGHYLRESADQIESTATEQLEAAEAYLIEHARDFGARDWHEALAGLAAIHGSTADYYGRFAATWERARAAAEAAEAITWPMYPIRYVPRPAWAKQCAPLLYFLPYRAPAPFDHVLPVDYLAPPIDPELPAEEQERLLRAVNDSVITLNHVIHHGGLGHHVQNYYAYRASSRIGQIAAVDCASRIAMFCGGTMAEGWACYATEFMDEIGFLTPLEHFAEQHAALRMAARAIVDTRMHRGQWTIDEAATFYRDRVGMEAQAAQGEAVKNSMFPGAALMYLSGTSGIRTLRREIERAQGTRFNLRAFHDRVISFGSVPVSMVREAMLEELPAP